MLFETKKTRTSDVHCSPRYSYRWLIHSVLVLSVVLISTSPTLASGVHALFDLSTPRGGPFPSDVFTVADPTQNTGLRVNLPYPDCSARPSDCRDLDVINALDGFNVQPRLSIPFDGPIDVSTVTSQTVFLISLGSTLSDGERRGRVIGINQVIWDPLANTLYAESDELLDQHTRYALIVTNGLHDAQGMPIEASEAFRRFRHDLNFGKTHDFALKDYRKELLQALKAARAIGLQENNIVTASVLTAQSVTAALEKNRDQVKAAIPYPADFFLAPGGNRTVFAVGELNGITFRQQTRENPAGFTSVAVPVSSLGQFMPGVVEKIAFGKYLSPDYEVHPGEFIPEIGTLTGVPIAHGENEIYFTAFLPSGPKPVDGWPVAIFVHGGPGNKDNDTYLCAASLANQGIATIAINAVGRGFGRLGTLTVNRTVGDSVTFPSGGRGFDQNANGTIAADEGAAATAPREIIGQRDALRQTTVDLMQLVRVIEVGMDVDGNGSSDLDASRIYYFGASFGGGLGVMFLAIEPNVRVGEFTVPGAAAGRIDLIRLRPAARGSVGTALASRTPSLINPPGLTSIGGIPVASPFFNENMPLRSQPPVINDVVGAVAIQEVFENAEWVSQSGDAATYAPYIRRAPLPGVPAKSVMVQFAKGDQTGSNPRTTAILRAGLLADRATFFRNDLAFGEDPTLPKDPHLFWTRFNSPGISGQIGRGAQIQFARFLATHGTEVIYPEPQRFFEVPVVLPLPEELDFIP